jgi:hypothetical protein
MTSKLKIACIRFNFLPVSETFIYQEINNMRNFDPIVLCLDRNNSTLFPYEKVRCYSKIWKVLKTSYQLIDKIGKRSPQQLISSGRFEKPMNLLCKILFSETIRNENIQ